MPKDKTTFYPYKLAKLIHYDLSQSKKWYIDFSAYDVQSGKMKRKRLFQFNSIKDIQQRKIYADNLVCEINELLTKGFHFDKVKENSALRDLETKKVGRFFSCKTAFDYIIKNRKIEVQHRTHQNIKSKLKSFEYFLEQKGLLFENIRGLDNEVARSYIDFLMNRKKQSPVSINNAINSLRTSWNYLELNGIVADNIFSKIKKQKESLTSKNIAYTVEQIKVIKDFLTVENGELWNFCQMIFYTFMRPQEIRSLRWENVDFEKGYIYLEAFYSKVKKERFVQIAKPLRLILQTMWAENGDLKSFIFYSKTKGKFYMSGNNYYPSNYRKALDKLGFSHDYTLYSWKHTGNVFAYRKGVGIYSLMRHNGHTQIETTTKYLKSLGLLRDLEFSEKMNDFYL